MIHRLTLDGRYVLFWYKECNKNLAFRKERYFIKNLDLWLLMKIQGDLVNLGLNFHMATISWC